MTQAMQRYVIVLEYSKFLRLVSSPFASLTLSHYYRDFDYDEDSDTQSTPSCIEITHALWSK